MDEILTVRYGKRKTYKYWSVESQKDMKSLKSYFETNRHLGYQYDVIAGRRAVIRFGAEFSTTIYADDLRQRTCLCEYQEKRKYFSWECE